MAPMVEYWVGSSRRANRNLHNPFSLKDPDQRFEALKRYSTVERRVEVSSSARVEGKMEATILLLTERTAIYLQNWLTYLSSFSLSKIQFSSITAKVKSLTRMPGNKL